MILRRPMTPDERRAAIALGGCVFIPASFDKRFCRGLAREAEEAEPGITEKQAALLVVMCHRYRRQIGLTFFEALNPEQPRLAI